MNWVLDGELYRECTVPSTESAIFCLQGGSLEWTIVFHHVGEILYFTTIVECHRLLYFTSEEGVFDSLLYFTSEKRPWACNAVYLDFWLPSLVVHYNNLLEFLIFMFSRIYDTYYLPKHWDISIFTIHCWVPFILLHFS